MKAKKKLMLRMRKRQLAFLEHLMGKEGFENLTFTRHIERKSNTPNLVEMEDRIKTRMYIQRQLT